MAITKEEMRKTKEKSGDRVHLPDLKIDLLLEWKLRLVLGNASGDRVPS
jgi:hypothetical protein